MELQGTFFGKCEKESVDVVSLLYGLEWTSEKRLSLLKIALWHFRNLLMHICLISIHLISIYHFEKECEMLVEPLAEGPIFWPLDNTKVIKNSH